MVADEEESAARRVGRRALREARGHLVQRALEQLQQREPEIAAELAANPGRAARVRAIERLLERSVERKPSLLGQVGLSAIQALSAAADEAGEAGDENDAAPGASARLAVVFTDLEGFTEWTEREGDEAASILLAGHHRTVGPIIKARGGRLVKRLGDGLLITFPEPAAAVLGCLELVDGQPEPLRLRAGVHVGHVVITPDDVIGHVVNLTARVAEAANGAEVVATGDVADAVADTLEPKVAFGPTRPERFKGIDGPVPICTVTWKS
jgi:adenylate cyclase